MNGDVLQGALEARISKKAGDQSLKKLLFVCVRNAARSQMAEAFANYYGSGRVQATSAGIKPADRVNPIVVDVMREKGMDLSEKKPKAIDTKVVQEADLVVTMGCGAEGVCPGPILGKAIEWKIENPKDKPIGEVRRIRDEIEKNVRALLDQI